MQHNQHHQTDIGNLIHVFVVANVLENPRDSQQLGYLKIFDQFQRFVRTYCSLRNDFVERYRAQKVNGKPSLKVMSVNVTTAN